MSGPAVALSNYIYPTALSWGYPHLEVLALSPNHSVHWKYRSSTAENPSDWTPPDTLGLVGGEVSELQHGVAAVSRTPGAMDIFVAGIEQTSYGLFHKYHNDSFEWEPVDYDSWDYLGGVLASGPLAVSTKPTRLDVFVIGSAPGYELFQKTWNDNVWGNWINLGGSWSKITPTAVVWGGGRIDVFVVNPETKALYTKGWDGSTWEPPDTFTKIGGYCTSRPVAITWGGNRVDVFARGGDAGLWHLSKSEDVWSDWTSISGNRTIQGEPSAVAWGPNHFDVFAWGSDNSLLHRSFDLTENQEQGVWTPSNGFEVIGQGLTGPPKVVSDASNNLHVFSYLQYGQLSHREWNQSVGRWMPDGEFEVLGLLPQSTGVSSTTEPVRTTFGGLVPAGTQRL